MSGKRLMFVTLAMFCSLSAHAFASECDPAAAASLGSYLGEVYCRGAYLPEDNVPSTCREEEATTCKDAFNAMVASTCPTADNAALRERLTARCGAQ